MVETKNKAKVKAKPKTVNKDSHREAFEEAFKVTKNKRIHITKVVSRNFLMDIWASLQNLVGTNLKAYERMVETAFEQIDDELTENEIVLSWYRHEVTQLTNGAVVVVLYGESK